MTWFQTEYLYRRKISLSSKVDVAAGLPARAYLPIVVDTNGKVRSDLEDIEVVYVDPQGDNQLIARSVEKTVDNIIVSFLLQEDLESDDVLTDRYYVYYGNPDLKNQPSRPTATIPDWPSTTPHDGGLISYTRPGEHWKDGVSSTAGSRMSLLLYTTKFRLKSEKGNNKGRFKIRVDFEDWEEIDLFSDATSQEYVWSIEGLSAEEVHELKVTVLPDSNPSSLGSEVNVISVDYESPAVGTDLGEEITTLSWSVSSGGD